MATIFPLDPNINDEYSGYRWDGTAWKIIGIDLTADYITETSISTLTNKTISDELIFKNTGSTNLIGADGDTLVVAASNINLSSFGETGHIQLNPAYGDIALVPGIGGIVKIGSNEIATQSWVTSQSYQPTVSGVSSTEIGYLDGVTSAIQTQLDAKLSSATAASTYQTIVSGVSNTEIGYLDGVTSSIQTQLDGKASVAPLTLSQAANNANYPLTISSANQQGGGTGYSDILKLTNSKSGATSPNKNIRISDSGTLEIINNAYTSTIFSLTDAGIVTANNLGDTGWTTVSSFSNNFTTSGGNTVQYRRLNGVVYLKGSVSGGTGNTTAFTLPTGYRPASGGTYVTQQWGTANITYITVNSDGTVQPNANAGWLTGVTFPVG